MDLYRVTALEEQQEERAGERTSHRSLRLFCSLSLLLSCSASAASLGEPSPLCVIVTGLGGMPEYEENFVNWGSAVERIFRDQLEGTVYRLDGRRQERAEIIGVFNQVSLRSSQEDVWLFLIGHGDYDGLHYRFNISGPDLTDEDVRGFLDGLARRRTYLIAATGASGVLIPRLSKDNRVVVSATKNQFERQPPLFLSFFIEAATSAGTDTDKNGKVSLLEAFLFAQKEVSSWFEEKGRLQTEHALLDDNGDGTGVARPNPANGEGSLASIAYLSAPSEQAYRTLEAQQLALEKVRIERGIEDLKYQKKDLPESDYYQKLETLLVRLATLNARITVLEAKK